MTLCPHDHRPCRIPRCAVCPELGEPSAAPSGALLLSRYAEELYGENWTALDLARALGVDLRTVQRWFSGNKEPPEAVLRIMRELSETLIEFRNQRPSSSSGS